MLHADVAHVEHGVLALVGRQHPLPEPGHALGAQVLPFGAASELDRCIGARLGPGVARRDQSDGLAAIGPLELRGIQTTSRRSPEARSSARGSCSAAPSSTCS